MAHNEKNVQFGTTEDYAMFNASKNQPTTRKHSGQLERAMLSVGYNIEPIIVNGDMVVQEGHGRLAVCKKHNLPLRYLIDRSIGKDAMKVLNSTSSNWKTRDYISHHANSNAKYKELDDFCQHEKFNIDVLTSWYGFTSTMIRDGAGSELINIPDLKEKLKVSNELIRITAIKNTKAVTRALGVFYKLDGFDDTRLLSQVKKYWHSLYPEPVDGQHGMAVALSKIYDYNTTASNRVHLHETAVIKNVA